MNNKLLKIVTSQINSTQDRLNELNAMIPIITEMDFRNTTFIIHVISNWHGEGEPNTRTVFKGSLSKAIRQSIVEFRNKNNRNDWQAYIRSVEVKIGDKDILLPRKMWSSIENKHSINPSL